MAFARSSSISDSRLLQIVDTALLTAAEKSGSWLVCKPGCSQCCIGAFAINQLDTFRLKAGMEDLVRSDPARAARVWGRAGDSVNRLSAEFPGDLSTGILFDTAEDGDLFENFANDEPCPALDPASGTCDLYSCRPMTCRIFGPPVRSDGGLGVCELCYHGATVDEIASCEMVADPDDLESRLVGELEAISGKRGNTVVAFALASFAPDGR